MASMQLFKPANEKYYNNFYSKQSLAKGWGHSAPSNPNCTNYNVGYNQNDDECFTEALLPPYGTGYHGSQSSVTQSTLIHGKPAVKHSYGAGFPVKPMGHHSAHGYSQQANYSSALQGLYGSASHGPYSFGEHESLGSGHVHLPMPQHNVYGLQQHGSFNPGHQGSYDMEQQECFGSTGQSFSGGWIKRKQKTYRRRTYSGYRSADGHDDSGSDSEEESEDETENNHH